MTERRDVTIYSDDILDTAGKAQRFIEGLSLDEFEQDDRTAFAVMRAFEILGEAAKSVPREFRDRAPEVPWQEMADMRGNSFTPTTALIYKLCGERFKRIYRG